MNTQLAIVLLAIVGFVLVLVCGLLDHFDRKDRR